MPLFRSGTALQVPFPGVSWNRQNGKILAKNEAWDTLSAEVQAQAFSMPAWDFLHTEGRIWSKHVIEDSGEIETFYLLPAEAYYDVIQRLERAQTEAKQLREQLHAFVQNVPMPLFVIEPERHNGQGRITFANKPLIELLHLPLRRLYEGLTLEDILGAAVFRGWSLLEKAQQTQSAVQEVVELPDAEHPRYWLLRAFPFQTSHLSGIIVGVIDLTKEKQQEQALMEAYQELQVQTEELRQNQEELLSVNEALEAARAESDARRQELEDSLKAAQRYQRTILFRTHTLYEAWGYERVSVVARAHTYVGGDFIISRRVGDWLYAGIGDATGHGSSGALLAVTVQSILHQALLQLSSPTQLHTVLEEVRRELADIWEVQLGEQLSNDGAEVAIIALPLSADRKHLYMATAGRPVYLLSPDGSVEEYLQGRRALGWSVPGQPLETYTTTTLPYPAGSTIFLFTDGITDQLGPSGKRLGRKAFLSWLPECAPFTGDPRSQTRLLLQKWNDWKSDSIEQTDDLLLLAFAL